MNNGYFQYVSSCDEYLYIGDYLLQKSLILLYTCTLRNNKAVILVKTLPGAIFSDIQFT